jgi:hypothetical protein
MALSLNIPFMKKAGEAKPGVLPGIPMPGTAAPGATTPPARSEEQLQLELCRIIIDRYRSTIEEFEAKSISDLKGRVRPHDAKIIELRDSITGDFHPFVFEEHFLQAAEMCFSFVSSFATISPPVSFWLEFSDMEKLMAGDEIDKSVLFCSLLRSLGCEDAKVLVNDSKRSCVLYSFGGKHYAAGVGKKGILEAKSREEALSLAEGKVLYCFNDKEHEDFQESD